MMSYILRTLLRYTVETYIVPGTTAGSEILWIYLISWKQEVTTLCVALSSFVFSDLDFSDDMTTPIAESQTGR